VKLLYEIQAILLKIIGRGNRKNRCKAFTGEQNIKTGLLRNGDDRRREMSLFHQFVHDLLFVCLPDIDLLFPYLHHVPVQGADLIYAPDLHG
jgi:hypothetical protein